MSTSVMPTHFPHLEDLVFQGPNLLESAELLISILEDWCGGTNPTQHMSLKWDGSPSLVIGKDPMTAEYFVATKSLFNKIPKVNYSLDDIERNHGENPPLCKLLTLALDLTHKSKPTHILQGDVLYTRETLNTFIFQNIEYLGFKTNTIQYAVNARLPECSRILKSELGIHFHRTLIGPSLTSLHPIYYIDPLSTDFVQDLHVMNTIGSSKFLSRNIMEECAQRFGRVMQTYDLLRHIYVESFMCFSVFTPRLYELLMQYENTRVREDRKFMTGEDYYQNVVMFISSKLLQKCLAMKTPAGRTRHEEFRDEMLCELERISPCLIRLFEFQQAVVLLKEFLIAKYSQESRYRCFATENGVLRETDHEGLVLHDNRSITPIKLINRYEFSRLNFLQHRETDHEFTTSHNNQAST